MIRALLLLFNPVGTWERVLEARRGIVAILFISLLPLLALTLAGECYGLVEWGKQRGEFGGVVQLAATALVPYVIAQLVLSLTAVFVGAFLVKAIGETFHGRHNYTQAFTVVAYGLGPLFLLRLLDALPRWPWWLSWVIGILLAMSTLYTGIPHIMRPDPAHALGLYFMSAIVLVFITGFAAFLAHTILERQFVVSFNVPFGLMTVTG